MTEILKNESYFASASHQVANWFATDYFVLGRQIVNLNTITHTDWQETRESFGSLALRVTSFATVLFPLIGLAFLAVDQWNWNNYKKGAEFEQKKSEWDTLFLKSTTFLHDDSRSENTDDGHPFRLREEYPKMLEALVRSDLRAENIKSKKIVANTDTYFYSSDGSYNSQYQDMLKLGINNILHLRLLANNPTCIKQDKEIEGRTLGNTPVYTINRNEFPNLFGRLSNNLRAILAAN